MAIVVNGKKVAGVGLPGKSAYQAAVEGGFTGNEQEFNESLAKRNIATRRNLLDNWYFVGGGSQQGGGQFPINQRGETSYTGNTYGIDRFKILRGRSNAITINDDWMTITFNEIGVFGQIIENVSIFSGQTVTISALCGDLDNDLLLRLHVNGSLLGSVNCYPNTITSNTIKLPTDLTSIQFEFGSASKVPTSYSVAVIAAKLEFGPTQTLAYQDEGGNWQLFETPDYAEELARCQRYLLVLPGFNTLFSNIGVGSFFSETEAEITIPTPTTMRIMPTCAATGNWLLRGGGQLINVEAGASNFFVQQMSSNAVSMVINGLSGCPANQATQLLRSNNSTAKITLSAEL